MLPTILICSNEEKTRNDMQTILGGTFPLIIVTDPDQCLSALQQKARPALAWVGTSANDSGELFTKIRRQDRELVVIAIGENGSEEEAIAAVSQGANGYTMLPLRKTDIFATAQKSLHIN